MGRKKVTTEHINITLPIGMADHAKKLGISISYQAKKAVQAEIEFQENK